MSNKPYKKRVIQADSDDSDDDQPLVRFAPLLSPVAPPRRARVDLRPRLAPARLAPSDTRSTHRVRSS